MALFLHRLAHLNTVYRTYSKELEVGPVHQCGDERVYQILIQ